MTWNEFIKKQPNWEIEDYRIVSVLQSPSGGFMVATRHHIYLITEEGLVGEAELKGEYKNEIRI